MEHSSMGPSFAPLFSGSAGAPWTVARQLGRSRWAEHGKVLQTGGKGCLGLWSHEPCSLLSLRNRLVGAAAAAEQLGAPVGAPGDSWAGCLVLAGAG